MSQKYCWFSQDYPAQIDQYQFRWKKQKQSSTAVPRNRCSENISTFTGGHSCQSVISIRLPSNFIEIAFRHECSRAKLQRIFRTSIHRNTSGRLPLKKIWYPKKICFERLMYPHDVLFPSHHGQLLFGLRNCHEILPIPDR